MFELGNYFLFVNGSLYDVYVNEIGVDFDLLELYLFGYVVCMWASNIWWCRVILLGVGFDGMVFVKVSILGSVV